MVVGNDLVGEPHRIADLLQRDVAVDDDVLALGRDEDLHDLDVRVLAVQRVEQDVLSGVSLHEVVSPLPVHAAPDAVAGGELVAGHLVDYVLPFVLDLGDLETPDLSGVADLTAASGIECCAVKPDPIAFDLNDLCLEFGNVTVLSEEFLSHNLACMGIRRALYNLRSSSV